MRKQWPIKISWFWIFFLPILCFGSVQMVYFHILLMLMMHESFHVISAIILKEKVSEIIIYPFGMCARIQYYGWGIPWKEYIIAIMGILSHGWIAIILYGCYQMQWISNSYYLYLSSLNHGLVLFNLLPIYPLDGFRMLQAIIHTYFPYRIAYRFTYGCSFVFLCLFHPLWFSSISALMIACGSFVSTLMHLIKCSKYDKQFYWYRYLHPLKGRKKIHHKQDLYRSYENYLIQDKTMLHESDWLYEKLAKW